jgi:hypothetical protein
VEAPGGCEGLKADGMNYEVCSRMQVLGFLLLEALVGLGFGGEVGLYFLFFLSFLATFSPLCICA